MSQIQVTARLSIHPDRLEDFKVLAAKCMESTRTLDSGTTQYDWFLNPDQTECVVRETYRDSDAVIEHVNNLGETLGALMTVADIDIEVYGTPSQELAEATTALAPRVYSPFQSM